LAANAYGLAQRLQKIGTAVAMAPWYGIVGQADRTLATRIAFASARGMSEDRVAVLCQEYAGNILLPSVLERGVELLETAHRKGHEIVLVSETLRPAIEPLLLALPVPARIVCNDLEYREGHATGRLAEPVIGGVSGCLHVLRTERERGVDLARSVAYGSRGPDLLLLQSVGSPCAVNPDLSLRAAARDADWPVLQYSTRGGAEYKPAHRPE
jgi:phosphoserine phosphatase